MYGNIYCRFQYGEVDLGFGFDVVVKYFVEMEINVKGQVEGWFKIFGCLECKGSCVECVGVNCFIVQMIFLCWKNG